MESSSSNQSSTTLTLTQENINELNNFLMDIPMRYGIPLFNYFQSLVKDTNTVKMINEEVELSKA